MAIKRTTRVEGTQSNYAKIITHSSNENIVIVLYKKEGNVIKSTGIEFTQEQFIDFNKAVSDVYFDKRINELEDILGSVPTPITISIPEESSIEKNKASLESIIAQKDEEIAGWKQVCVNNKEAIAKLEQKLRRYEEINREDEPEP